MTLIAWSSTFSVNIKIFDEQHKNIVTYINEIHNTYRDNNDKAYLEKMLDKLYAYVNDHLAVEEEYFAKYNYPDQEKHIKEHQRYVENITKFQQKFEEEQDSKEAMLELLNFLSKWLMTHIQETDKAYISFFNDKGVY